MIIAAHPDDEVLGMGGTIKKFSKAGHYVKIVFMATGILSRRSENYKNYPDYNIDKKITKTMNKQLKDLRKDAKKAAKIMGVKEIQFIDFPDNEMDKVSNLEVIKMIEKNIQKFKPEIVFTHSNHDINIDHQILYKATITATRPISGTKIKKVFAFEVPSSTEWNFPSNFSPNVFVDISKELTYKLKAIKVYKNEIKKFPHPRSVQSLEIIAKRWGTVCGFNAAEPFYLIRQLTKKI